MNKINKFKINQKTNRMLNWFSPVTASFGVAAVTTLIAMTPFQTVNGAVPESKWVNSRDAVSALQLTLIPRSDGGLINFYKAYNSEDNVQEYFFSPAMDFVLNPENSSIVQGVSEEVKYDGTKVVVAGFCVDTYNPTFNALIASSALKQGIKSKVFSANTNIIRFSPLPAKSVAVKVMGSDKTPLASMDPQDVLLEDGSTYSFSIVFTPDKYEQFMRDLEKNAVTFEFTLCADQIKYDKVDIKVKGSAEISNAFKSLLGSKKEILLDQDSFQSLTHFINMNLDITADTTDPKYLENIGLREAMAMQFIKYCFDVSLVDPNYDRANSEILKISELPETVITSQDGREECNVDVDENGDTEIINKTLKGGTGAKVPVKIVELQGNAEGGWSDSEVHHNNHMRQTGLKISHEKGETGNGVGKHSYVRLVLRDGVAGMKYSTQQHIRVLSQISSENVIVQSAPKITRERVMNWANDFIKSREKEFEGKRSEFLKKYDKFADNNTGIETQKNQIKQKFDQITSRLSGTRRGSTFTQINTELESLLKDGIWRALEVKVEVSRDSENPSARFQKAIENLHSIEVRLTDEEDDPNRIDTVVRLEQFKPSESNDQLEKIQDIDNYLVQMNDLTRRLSVLLGSGRGDGVQDKFLNNLKYLNGRLRDIIVNTQ